MHKAVLDMSRPKYKVGGIGINEYLLPNNTLTGCVPDNLHMKKLCEHRGIPEKNMQFIYDADATYKNCLEVCEWLGDGLAEEDWAVLFWSSHGTYDVDLDGDETDKYDEILCCYDINWDKKGRVLNGLSDDKIAQIISKSRCRWAIFIDACHSELFDKNFNRWKPKTFTPPADIRALHQQANRRMMKCRELFNGIERLQMISACQARQTSADTFLGGEPRGAGSYYFEDIQYKAPKTICTDISVELCVQMERNGYTQRPVAQGGLIHLPFAGGLQA